MRVIGGSNGTLGTRTPSPLSCSFWQKCCQTIAWHRPYGVGNPPPTPGESWIRHWSSGCGQKSGHQMPLAMIGMEDMVDKCARFLCHVNDMGVGVTSVIQQCPLARKAIVIRSPSAHNTPAEISDFCLRWSDTNFCIVRLRGHRLRHSLQTKFSGFIQ